MPKYEELVKEKNKGSIRIDELAKKYKMSVIDVKNVRQMVHDAELETSLVKAVGMNSPEMKAAKEEINDLKNKIANLDDALRSKDYWRDPDYKFLVEENAEVAVAGSIIDYDSSLGGAAITIKNPNVQDACGCGVSFNLGGVSG